MARRRTETGDPAPDPAQQDREPDPHDVARQIVLRQLTLAPRSRAQLEDKLRQRDCPDDVAAAVLDRLTEVGLVDDEAYAQMLVRSQQAGRGLARRALARELRSKGIDPELAAETLDGIDDESERERARELRGQEAAVDARAERRGADPPPRGDAGPQGLRLDDVVRGDPRGDRRRSRAPA